MTDQSTLEAYRRYAVVAMKNWGRMRTPAKFLREFARSLPPQSTVLDYGCGIGTEMAWLSSKGFQVEGVDGIQAFINEAKRRCPGVPLTCSDLRDFKITKKYDAVWCNATLIHFSPSEFREQLEKLRGGLKPGGILGLTMAWGRSKKTLRNDWIPGRYIACYTFGEILPYFKNWNVQNIKVVSNDGREGRWIQVLAVVK